MLEFKKIIRESKPSKNGVRKLMVHLQQQFTPNRTGDKPMQKNKTDMNPNPQWLLYQNMPIWKKQWPKSPQEQNARSLRYYNPPTEQRIYPFMQSYFPKPQSKRKMASIKVKQPKQMKWHYEAVVGLV